MINNDFKHKPLTRFMFKYYWCLLIPELKLRAFPGTTVKFVNEYRLFIGNNKLYGITESSYYLLDSKNIKSVDPPESFIKDIIHRLNGYDPNIFCVVDVGLLDINQWTVVEANPPFALNNYDFPIDKYYDYCKLAYDSIMK